MPRQVLRLATTTSTRDSGLLDVVLPPFEKGHNVRVGVIAVGTGKALKLGEAGDCDVVLVGTPFDLAQRLRSDKPMLRVRYVTEESKSEPGAPTLADAVLALLTKRAAKAIA